MWGYIDSGANFDFDNDVPSLYVRVYRNIYWNWTGDPGSLIICEGISRFPCFWVFFILFPHYMWGYIEVNRMRMTIHNVPSLYVRVYRLHIGNSSRSQRSLIICEGISQGTLTMFSAWRFPNYMWGYIEPQTSGCDSRDVPSLYVMVYRVDASLQYIRVRSLIICEGISTGGSESAENQEFPHYMWGYIA